MMDAVIINVLGKPSIKNYFRRVLWFLDFLLSILYARIYLKLFGIFNEGFPYDFTVLKSTMLTLVHCLTRKSFPLLKSQAEAWQTTPRPSDGFSSMLPANQTNIICIRWLELKKIRFD